MNAPASKHHSLVTRLLIALIVAFSLLATPLATQPAYAKSLKASGVKFTKEGKVIKSKIWHLGAGLQNCTYSIKSIRVKKAKKPGYKVATVIFEVKQNWKLNNRQIIAMWNNMDYDGYLPNGWTWAFVVDGKTGEYLHQEEIAQKYDITLKTNGWKYYNDKRYTAKDGTWVELPKVCRIKYTITYPKNYKNLYVGVGVGQKLYNERQMAKFEAGRVTYGKSWWHKNNKNSTHFVRVR